MTQYVFNDVDGSVTASCSLLDDLSLIKMEDSIYTVGPPKMCDEKRKHVLSEDATNNYSSIHKENDFLLVINGSGNFHHHTYGFCRGLVEQDKKPYTVVHFDQHGDAKNVSNELACGNYLVNLTNDSEYVQKAVIIGASVMIADSQGMDTTALKLETEIYPYAISEGSFLHMDEVPDIDVKKGEIAFGQALKVSFHRIKEEGIEQISQRAINRMKTDDVYITVDLDVLTKDYVETEWGNGFMTLDQLLTSIKAIKSEKNVIGLDICGTNGKDEIGKAQYTIAAIVNEITDGPYSQEFFEEKIQEFQRKKGELK